MLGDRSLKDIVLRTIDDIYRDLNSQMDRTSDQRIGVEEVISCLRKSYYERKSALLPKRKDKVRSITRTAMKKLAKNGASNEFSIDSDLSLVAHADAIGDDVVIRFVLVDELPKTPLPPDLLAINATMWIFDTIDSVIVYMTDRGDTVEFSLIKDKKMFEEAIRRARVLSTLLKEGKVPIIEPSEECLTCPYYDRCYLQEKKYTNITLEKLFGLKKDEE